MEDKAQSLLLTNVIIEAFFSPTQQFCLHWDPHSHWQDHGLRLNLTLGWNSNDCNCFLFLSLWSPHQRVVRKLCIYVVKREVMITRTCGWLGGILYRVLAVVIHADIPVWDALKSGLECTCRVPVWYSLVLSGCLLSLSDEHSSSSCVLITCWTGRKKK